MKILPLILGTLVIGPILGMFLYLRPFPWLIFTYNQPHTLNLIGEYYCFEPKAPKIAAFDDLKQKITLLNALKIPSDLLNYNFCILNRTLIPIHSTNEDMFKIVINDAAIKAGELKCFDYSEVVNSTIQWQIFQCSDELLSRKIDRTQTVYFRYWVFAYPQYWFLLPFLIMLTIASIWLGLLKKIQDATDYFKIPKSK